MHRVIIGGGVQLLVCELVVQRSEVKMSAKHEEQLMKLIWRFCYRNSSKVFAGFSCFQLVKNILWKSKLGIVLGRSRQFR